MKTALSVAALVVGGCGHRPAPSASASATASHQDQLAPNELVIGSAVAFGLPLPEALHVRSTDGLTVQADGRIAPDVVANYLREKTSGGRVEVGPSKTEFNNVTIPTLPFKGSLTIWVMGTGTQTSVTVFANRIIDIPNGPPPPAVWTAEPTAIVTTTPSARPPQPRR